MSKPDKYLLLGVPVGSVLGFLVKGAYSGEWDIWTLMAPTAIVLFVGSILSLRDRLVRAQQAEHISMGPLRGDKK